MFTVEVRINGSLINHIYGHNEGPSKNLGEDLYRYELYTLETRQVVLGNVTHRRSDGINSLIVKILNNTDQNKPVKKENK